MEKEYLSKRMTLKFRYILYLNFDDKRFEKYFVSYRTSQNMIIYRRNTWFNMLMWTSWNLSISPWIVTVVQQFNEDQLKDVIYVEKVWRPMFYERSYFSFLERNFVFLWIALITKLEHVLLILLLIMKLSR